MTKRLVLFPTLAIPLVFSALALAAPKPRRPNGAASKPKGIASALPTPAVAPTPTALAPAAGKPKALAEELTGSALASYEQGKVLFEHGDFGTAHAKFKQAYDASGNPRLLWNMAACSAKEKRYALAIAEVERHLELGRRTLTPEQIEKADAFRAEVSGYVATATVSATPSGAMLRIDDEPRGELFAPRNFYLDVGKHEVHLEKADHEPLTQTVTVRDVGKVTFAFTLKPVAVAATRLVVQTDVDGVIEVDGAPVGKGLYEGDVKPGVHRLRIVAPGKVPYEAVVEVASGATKQLTVTLSAAAGALAPVPVAGAPRDEASGAWWPWAVGGAVLAAGAGVGAYVLMKPEPIPGIPTTSGTLGTLEVR
jgi:hypothetical protein